MKENKLLYVFEGIASIFVILIHCPFPGNFGYVIESIGRISVPFFFMISGFSIFSFINTDEFVPKLKVRIKRLIILFLVWFTIYFLFDFIKCIIKEYSYSTFLFET